MFVYLEATFPDDGTPSDGARVDIPRVVAEEKESKLVSIKQIRQDRSGLAVFFWWRKRGVFSRKKHETISDLYTYC